MQATSVEILEIREEIRRLNDKLKHLTSRKTLAEQCSNMPYTSIRYCEEKGGLYFSKFRSDVWDTFREMSKRLFLINREINGGIHGSVVIVGCPRKVVEMTPEQQAVAAEFLDEVCEVFNKYFVEVNRMVIVDGKPVEVKAAE